MSKEQWRRHLTGATAKAMCESEPCRRCGSTRKTMIVQLASGGYTYVCRNFLIRLGIIW